MINTFLVEVKSWPRFSKIIRFNSEAKAVMIYDNYNVNAINDKRYF